MPNYDGDMCPSASVRPRRRMPPGKWSRSLVISRTPLKLKPFKVTCMCCGNLVTYEEHLRGMWCTKHQKMYDKNLKKIMYNLPASPRITQKIIFANGSAIYRKEKLIKIKLSREQKERLNMMDLEIACPHCGAKVGEFCKEKCEVNGKKIKTLENSLNAVNLTANDICVKKNCKKRCTK